MKGYLYIFTVLFCSAYSFAQKPIVDISIDYDHVEVGDPVIIIVRSNVAGTLNIKFPDEFISGSSWQRGAEQVLDPGTSKLKTMYFFSQNGAFSKAGTYSFKAYINDKNTVYKSKSLTVKVDEQAPANEAISRRNMRRPVFGIVERSKARVYEGEPLILNGKIYTKLKISDPQGYHPFELDGNAEVIKLSRSEKLSFSPEILKGQKFSSATFGKQIVFFTTPGKYQINPFEMAVLYEIEANFKEPLGFTSSGSSVEVVPLPSGAPHDFIGAVGKYSFTRSFDKSSAAKGDVITMTVVVSGYGNLHNINTPEVKLPKGIAVYGDPETIDDIHFGMRGAEGTMTFKFNLQVTQGGEFKIPAMTISYFDPDKKKYITLKEEETTIQGDAAGFEATLPDEIEKTNDETIGLEPVLSMSSAKSDDHFLKSPLFWPTVVSPIALAFVGGLFFTRRKKISEKITEKSRNKERLQSIQQLFKTAESQLETNDVQQAFCTVQQALKTTATVVLKSESSISRSEMISGMQETGIAPSDIEQFNRLLMVCEEARYAFMDQTAVFRSTLQESKELTHRMLQ